MGTVDQGMGANQDHAGPPTVGSSYQGERGLAYFDWQNAKATPTSAEIDSFKFTPHVRPSDTVVDFGCGAGHLLAGLQVARRIGIEASPHARAAAAARGIETLSSAGDLEPGVADVVLSHHALEHTLSPWAELVDLRRILKPGGRLVLWLPLDDWRRSWQREAAGPDESHHLYTWTPRLMWNLLSEAGYDVLEVRVVAHAWPPAREVLWRVLPERVFHLVARVWSSLRRERQVYALATPRSSGP
jgi:SAM-dependent methyltransferase